MSIYESKIYQDELAVSLKHAAGLDKLYGSTILITGATGLIGSFLTDALVKADEIHGADIKVIACGRSLKKLSERFEQSSAIRFIEYDLLKEIPKEFDDISPDYIIHAAGNASPKAFLASPENTVLGNVEGTGRLLEYARDHGCKEFLYVSSGEVYSVPESVECELDEIYAGCALQRPDDARYFAKDTLKLVMRDGERTCYPYSKLAAEKLVLSDNAPFGAMVARLCHTFGPGSLETDDRAHAQFARKAAAGEDIVLNSAGLQLRSYNCIVDAAAGILSIIACGQKGACYDVCSRGNEITIRGLAELMAKAGGVKVLVKEATSLEKKFLSPIHKQVLDPSELEEIGFTKAYDLETGVRNYLEFLKEALR